MMSNIYPKSFQDYPSLCFCLMFVTCYWLIGDLFGPQRLSFFWELPFSGALGGAFPGLIDSDSLGQNSSKSLGSRVVLGRRRGTLWRFCTKRRMREVRKMVRVCPGRIDLGREGKSYNKI